MSFHEFNSFTGRLKETTRFVPAMPIKPRLLNIADEPKMIYDSIKTKPVITASYGTDNGNTPKYSSPAIEKLMKKKAYFTADLERPVYLYRGKPDKILFGVTCALMGVGLLEAIHTFYLLAHQ